MQPAKPAFALGAASSAHIEEDHHGSIDPDALIVETFGPSTPGLPAILVKPKTIADAYRLRQEYRTGSTLGVFPGEVLTRLYATLGDAKMILSAVAAGSQGLLRQHWFWSPSSMSARGVVRSVRCEPLALPAFPYSPSSGWSFSCLLRSASASASSSAWRPAQIGAQLFAAKSGVILPVGFTREDLRLALVFLGFAAILAAVPALLAYRQSPATALRA